MKTYSLFIPFKWFLVVAMCLFMNANLALAETIHTVDCVDGSPEFGQCLTGVSGLVVSGTSYNVYFTEESFLNLFGDPSSVTFSPPTFWQDEATAGEAFFAIQDIATTNQLGYRMDNSTTIWGEVTVPYDVTWPDPNPFDETYILSWYSVGPDLISYFDTVRPTAVFSVVPVPPAVWLFGSGLIGLIGVARRKKA
jgi:hypothetical protein